MKCCSQGNMNGFRNRNINNNVNNESINNEEGYQYNPNYPYNPNNEGFYNGNFGGFFNFPRQIFEFNRGNNVDLVNLNVGDRVAVAQLTVDLGPGHEHFNNNFLTNNSVIKISFSSNLNFSMTLNEEIDLLFRLYRQDCSGARVELTSVPYRLALYGTEETENELTSTITEFGKSETFYTEYFDELKGGGMFTYIMEVTPTFSSITRATISGGYISATGQVFSGCAR